MRPPPDHNREREHELTDTRLVGAPDEVGTHTFKMWSVTVCDLIDSQPR
jgi:hypothetical protein